MNAASASNPLPDASSNVPERPGFAVRLPATELTPISVSRDRTKLILIDDAGSEYVVPLGARLRTVLTDVIRSNPDPEQKVETPMPSGPTESALRPRDIQQRIRAGETPEHVAEVAGISVERVMVFASPVLAEREHVAATALTASVRRKTAHPESTERTLGQSADQRLSEAGVDPEGAITWDAWRRTDGRWTLQGAYEHGGVARVASFTLDLPGRFVIADDDEARWLVGDGHFDNESHHETTALGDDAIELVSADADWIARPAAPQAPEVAPSPSPAREPMARPAAVPPAEPVQSELPLGGPTKTHAEPKKPAKRKGRSSIPSWDEIMFGGPDSPDH